MGDNSNQLTSRTWTPRQIKFMAWLITDEYSRIPGTQKELAKQIGTTEETLSRWKKLPGWDEELARLTWDTLGSEFPQIVNALIRGAKKENPVHIRMILELLGYLSSESNNQNVTNIVIAEAHNYLDPPEVAPGTSTNGQRIVEVQRR